MKREKYTPKPCVYVITHVPTVRYYVGKTVDARKRWYQHKGSAKNGNTYIARSLRRYGIEQFQFDVVAEFDTEDMAYEAEKKLVGLLRSNVRGHGFNIAEGGEGGKQLLVPRTDEYRAIMRAHHADMAAQAAGEIPETLESLVCRRVRNWGGLGRGSYREVEGGWGP